MRLGGRIQAASEVLDQVERRHRPVSEALKDWGLSHRFAGSGDRAVIGNLVYDALRWQASSRWRMDSDDLLSLIFAIVVYRWKRDWAALSEELQGDKFAPDLPAVALQRAADMRQLSAAPDWVQADMPKWLIPHFQANFDEDWLVEANALNARPPLDIRVNTLKSSRSAEAAALAHLAPVATPIALNGLRVPPSAGARRHPNVQIEESYLLGRIEVQDESSQIASSLIFAQPDETILDYCAGAGGKTLALAADMQNQGKLYAYDAAKARLAPIYDRLGRSGATHVTVLPPDDARLAGLLGACDRVVVDAPCSGSGTWRRRPDAKWRLSKKQLGKRCEEQADVLEEAAPFVRSGGFLIYMTCSVLGVENEESVSRFLSENPAFEQVSAGEVWQDIFGFDKPKPWSSDMMSLTMTPASTGTDGFFFAVMQNVGEG